MLRIVYLCGAMLTLAACPAVLLGQGAAAAGEEPSEPAAIDRFVATPEEAYQWRLVETVNRNGLTMYRLELTSQAWHGVTWKHALTIFEPADLQITDQVLLFVSGGDQGESPGLDEQLVAISLANMCGGRVALLNQVPNQPLLGNRKEDDLISETWLRYLESGDESWPLLFPMVKSAVKAMDAVTELGRERDWESPVESFVITGASKRGWTSWLTPVVDDRIVATAPIVIDTLNFNKQMKYQKQVWGAFSEQIADYTSKGLVTAGEEPRSPREERLLAMMDPWTYRERLELPKLIINGTNDRYWVVDAAKNYYRGLSGPKNLLEIPNAGHSLDGGRALAIAGIAALFRAASSDARLPELTWSFNSDQHSRTLKVSADKPVHEARLWMATSLTNDFREAEWTSQVIRQSDGRYRVVLPEPPEAETRQAFFAELEFADESISPRLTYSLTTIVKTYLDGEGK